MRYNYVLGRRDPATDTFELLGPKSGLLPYVACEEQKPVLRRLTSDYRLYLFPSSPQGTVVQLCEGEPISDVFPTTWPLSTAQSDAVREAIKEGGRWLEPGDPRLQPRAQDVLSKPRKKKKNYDR